VKTRLPGIHRLAVAAGLAFVLVGCSGEDAAERGAAAGRAAAAERLALRAGADTLGPGSPDAAPGERQLPTPIRRALRKPLETWTLSWRLALPMLRLDQFERGATVSFAAEEATPYDGGFEGADLRLQHLVVPSPEVWLLVDPFLDLELEPADDGGVRAVRGDEPGVAVLDLRARTERRVLDLPAGSCVDGAHWLDARRVAVLVDEPARGGRRPVVYLVHIAGENAVRYAGPVADPAEARAARTDLDRRFRAARPALHLAAL
jgi:hypothetical protein